MGTIKQGISTVSDIGKHAITEAGKSALKTFAGAGPMERATLAAPAGKEAFMTAGMFGGTGPTTEMQLQALAASLFGPGGMYSGGGGGTYGGYSGYGGYGGGYSPGDYGGFGGRGIGEGVGGGYRNR